MNKLDQLPTITDSTEKRKLSSNSSSALKKILETFHHFLCTKQHPSFFNSAVFAFIRLLYSLQWLVCKRLKVFHKRIFFFDFVLIKNSFWLIEVLMPFLALNYINSNAWSNFISLLSSLVLYVYNTFRWEALRKRKLYCSLCSIKTENQWIDFLFDYGGEK